MAGVSDSDFDAIKKVWDEPSRTEHIPNIAEELSGQNNERYVVLWKDSLAVGERENDRAYQPKCKGPSEKSVNSLSGCIVRRNNWFSMLWPFFILAIIIAGAYVQSKYFQHPMNVQKHGIRANDNRVYYETDFMFLKTTINEHARYFRDGPDESRIGIHYTYPNSLHTAPDVFKQYLHWHARKMRCLRNSTCYMNKKAEIKILLWKCPSDSALRCAGSGDRMRGIVTSLALAMMNRRVFLLEWPDNPYPFTHGVSPAAIDWRLPEHIKNDTKKWGMAKDDRYPILKWLQCPLSYVCYHGETGSTARKPVRRSLSRVIDLEDANTFVYLRRIGNFIIHSVGTYSFNLYRRPEWVARFPDDSFRSPTTREFQMNRYLLRALFKPSPFVESILHSLIFPGARLNGYVSIHARTGEDVGETNWKRFKVLHEVDHEAIAERFLRCARQMGIQSHGFVYFASDSMPLKSAFTSMANRYGLNVMVSKLPAIHVAHELEKENSISTVDNLLRDVNWLSFVNIFVEFFALSNGTSIISNKSEFSRLAHLLSNADGLNTLNISDSVSCA